MKFRQEVAVGQGELRPIQEASGGLWQVSWGIAINLLRERRPQEVVEAPEGLQKGLLQGYKEENRGLFIAILSIYFMFGDILSALLFSALCKLY